MNLVVLLGRLTRDPDGKFFGGGRFCCRFAIATNRRHTKQDGTSVDEPMFIECVAFGSVGETIVRNFMKGRPILIRGYLRFDTWEDLKNGQKRHRHSVVVEHFSFTDSAPQAQEPEPEAIVPDRDDALWQDNDDT